MKLLLLYSLFSRHLVYFVPYTYIYIYIHIHIYIVVRWFCVVIFSVWNCCCYIHYFRVISCILFHIHIYPYTCIVVRWFCAVIFSVWNCCCYIHYFRVISCILFHIYIYIYICINIYTLWLFEWEEEIVRAKCCERDIIILITMNY